MICAKSRFTNAKTPLPVSLSFLKANGNINLSRNINLPFLEVKKIKPTSHRSLTSFWLKFCLPYLTGQTPREKPRASQM